MQQIRTIIQQDGSNHLGLWANQAVDIADQERAKRREQTRAHEEIRAQKAKLAEHLQSSILRQRTGSNNPHGGECSKHSRTARRGGLSCKTVPFEVWTVGFKEARRTRN